MDCMTMTPTKPLSELPLAALQFAQQKPFVLQSTEREADMTTDSVSSRSPAPVEVTSVGRIRMQTSDLNVHYGDTQALHDISLEIPENQVTALIGPSGCGKSTYLRCLNRMNDVIDSCRVEGSVKLDDADIYGPEVDVVELRARIGMVFQKPNPFPKSIYDNVAYGPRIHGLADSREELDSIVMESLEQARLFDEVKDRLQAPGTSLSGGQQQRVAVARALANEPAIILADEPTANLDLVTGGEIIQLLASLSKELGVTVVSATHDHKMLDTSDRILWIKDGGVDRLEKREDLDIKVGTVDIG